MVIRDEFLVFSAFNSFRSPLEKIGCVGSVCWNLGASRKSGFMLCSHGKVDNLNDGERKAAISCVNCLVMTNTGDLQPVRGEDQHWVGWLIVHSRPVHSTI